MVYNADFSAHSESIKVSYLAGPGFDNYLYSLKDPSLPIWQEIKTNISDYKPDVVGISAKSQNFTSACIVAKLAKEIDDKITVIIGGPHASMAGSEVLQCSAVDLAVKGEGEITIVEALNAIESKKNFEPVKGIIYRNGNQIMENPAQEFIEDLGSLAFPNTYAKEALKDYGKYPRAAFGYIFATRGCPYNCFFCGSRNIWGRQVRFRSPDNVAEEIRGLREEGVRIFYFVDDTFGINKQYISDLCRVFIERCPGIKWSCEFHIKLVDDETISLMKRAGCYQIQLGIESGNNDILKQMRKNITIEEALAAAEIIKKHGIELQVFFIIGFPQETEETLNDTIMAMQQIKGDIITYSIFTPYPGTEAFAFSKEKGLIPGNYDISLYNHQSPLNHFCVHITPKRFRVLAAKIEKMVDRKNSLNKIKRVFSPATPRMIQELGITKSMQKGVRIFMGR